VKAKKLFHLLPILILSILSLLLFLSNYGVETYLLGWDVTTPEFNFSLNLKRIIFSLWQEYRGLGSLDGQAHSANIVHWLYIFLLSLIFPNNSLRYIFIVLTHLLGGIGMYLLLYRDILPAVLSLQKKKDLRASSTKIANRLHSNSKYQKIQRLLMGTALIGALFYQFNLMTIQMYHLAFELFVIHFAVFPWGIWALRRYLRLGNYSALFFLILLNLLGVSQAHVPTIFIPYALVMAIILFFNLFSKLNKDKLKRVLIAGLTLILVHSFWGLPYVYSALSKSAEITNAKQNRFSTEGIFYRSHRWGDLASIAKFGGMHLGFYDWHPEEKQFRPIMKEWLEFYQSSPYQLIAIFFTVLSLLGIVILSYSLIKKKNKALPLSLIVIWALALLMLGTNIPIIGSISSFLRNTVPFFAQIFRFTFTKFALLYALIVSILISVTTLFLIRTFSQSKFYSFLASIFLIPAVILILFLASPAFKGLFFYPLLRVKVPANYFELFSFLDKNYQQSRIASFPIHSFWGWLTNTNDWGYRGSGFDWQAIPQAMHHRSFDPWSKKNETAFLQMNRALYSLDEAAFQKTFEKYHTNLILLDRSVFNPGSYVEARFAQETDDFFEQLPTIRKEQSFKNLELYSIDNQGKNLSLETPKEVILVDVNYHVDYTSKDQAYLDHGPYLQKSVQGITYLFSALQKEELSVADFEVKDSALLIPLKLKTKQALTFPTFSSKTSKIPAALLASQENNNLELTIDLQLPQLYQGNRELLNISSSETVTLKINGQEELLISIGENIIHLDLNELSEKEKIIRRFSLSSKEEAKLKVFQTSSVAGEDFTEFLKEKELDSCWTNWTRTHSVSKKADSIHLASFNADACVKFNLASGGFPYRQGQYLVAVTSRFRTDDDLYPQICIHQLDSSKECENSKNTNYILPSEQWQSVSEFAAIDLSKNYEVYLKSKNTEKDTPQSIEYDDVLVFYFALVDEFKLDIQQKLANFDQKLQNLDLEQNNELAIAIPYGQNKAFVVDKSWQEETGRELAAKNCAFEEKGEVKKKVLANGIEYWAKDQAILCENLIYPSLDFELEYLYHLKGENSQGVGLSLSLINPLTKRADIEAMTPDGAFNLFFPVYPSKNNSAKKGFFLLNLSAESYGKEENIIQVERSEFITAPLSWLSSIYSQDEQSKLNFDTELISQKKWGTSFYAAKIKVSSEQGLLVLPQAFDRGWIAFIKPKLWKTLAHWQYNGWANAWILPQGEELELLIIYWPQLLNFLGYLLLAGLLIVGATKLFFTYFKKQ
jgi:hypothetical protein